MSRSFLNTSHQTIGWFIAQNEASKLDLRPPFQRRPVWTDEEKSFLIDSVLRGYPIPEIYTYVYDRDGTDVVAVVDGQQRLLACLDFAAELFPVSFDVEKLRPLHSLADTPWYNKRFSGLERDEREALRRYKLIVRELEEVTDEELRHMFHRLNQSNFSLNAQELRYSMYKGGLLSAVETIAKLPEWETIGIFTVRQRRRMLDSEYIGELVIGYLHWPQDKKASLDHYYRQYGKSFPFNEQVSAQFSQVLKLMLDLYPKPRMGGTRWYRKSDFYTLFLAIARGLIPAEIDLDELRMRLTEFSALVSSDAYEDDEGPVGRYRRAVARAATDRSRRVNREVALLEWLGVPTATTEEVVSEEDDKFEGDDSEEDDGEYEDVPG